MGIPFFKNQKQIPFITNFLNNLSYHSTLKHSPQLLLIINYFNSLTAFMNQYSVDDTLDLLKEFLPDIETELRDQIYIELQDEYELRKEEAMKNIEMQAEREYMEALATMEEEVEELKGEKEHELEKELVHLQQISNQRDRQMLTKAQEKFLQEHFDDKILTHQAFRQIEDDLETQIAESLFQKYSTIRDKRVKQLRVRLENKEQKQRAQADKAIKQSIYNQSGLSEIKEDLNKFKISIAAQKSQYNIKISKLSTEIKALQAKCKEIQYANSDLLIEQLERQIQQIQQLQSQRESRAEKNANNDSSLLNLHRDNARFVINQQNPRMSFGINPMKSDVYNQQTNFVNEDFSLDSSDSLDESNSMDGKGLLPPPIRCQRMNLQFDHRNKEQESDNEIYIQLPPKPLLSFNVGKMLRQKWEEDSFDRFLSKKSQKYKENLQNVNNQPQSNFQSLYTQHLKKLNRDMKAPKLRNLSQKAKQQIIANLSSNHSYREQYYL